MSDATTHCNLGQIDLLDDNISTSHQIQARNVHQLYLLSVEVRALMDVVCQNGQSSLLADRIEHHARQLEAQFLDRAEKRRSLSLSYQFFMRQKELIDDDVTSIVGALRALDDKGQIDDEVHDHLHD